MNKKSSDWREERSLKYSKRCVLWLFSIASVVLVRRSLAVVYLPVHTLCSQYVGAYPHTQVIIDAQQNFGFSREQRPKCAAGPHSQHMKHTCSAAKTTP